MANGQPQLAQQQLSAINAEIERLKAERSQIASSTDLRIAELERQAQKNPEDLSSFENAIRNIRSNRRNQFGTIDAQISGFERARSYATGEFTTESVLGFARARGRFEVERAIERPEPQLKVTLSEIPAQQLPGVIVRDFFKPTPEEILSRSPTQQFRESPLAVTAAPKDPFSDAIRDLETSGRFKSRFPLAEEFAIGFGKGVIGLGSFGSSLVSDFGGTLKATGKGFVDIPRRVFSGEGFPEIGRTLRDRPGEALGRATFEIGVFKGFQTLSIKAPAFVGGKLARLEPGFRKVTKLETGEKFILDVPEIGDIGLIPGGSGISRKGLSSEISKRPTVRGAFGFTQTEQKAQLGRLGVATSQRGFIPRTLGFRKGTAEIREIEGFGLFGTPRSKEGFLMTRETRLGELPKVAKIEDIISGNIGFKRTPPEIITFPKERVGRKGGFETLGKLSSELETATLPPPKGARFIDLRKVGVTTIGIRRTPIFIGKFREPKITTMIPKQITSTEFKSLSSTITEKPQVSLESLGVQATSKISPITTSLPSMPIFTSRISTEPSLRLRPSIIRDPLRKPSGIISRGTISPSSFSPPPESLSRISPIKKTIIPSGISTSNIFPDKTINPPARTKFKFPQLGFEPKKSKINKPRTFARRPSLVALGLNIKAPKPVKGEETGLVIRPLLNRRKRK